MYCINWRGVLLALVVAVATTNANAQSYYNTPNDTITADAAYEDVGVYNIIQRHTVADTIYFYWRLQSVDMPASWVATLCVNSACYDTLMTTGSMGPIVAGDDGLMSLHLNPGHEAGTGIIRYSLYASNSIVVVDTPTWIITAREPNALTIAKQPLPEVIVADRTIRAESLGSDYAMASLYDLQGRILYEAAITDGKLRIDLTDYMPQLMLLRLSGKRRFITRILNY